MAREALGPVGGKVAAVLAPAMVEELEEALVQGALAVDLVEVPGALVVVPEAFVGPGVLEVAMAGQEALEVAMGGLGALEVAMVGLGALEVAMVGLWALEVAMVGLGALQVAMVEAVMVAF
jgi:hypothetical protein